MRYSKQVLPKDNGPARGDVRICTRKGIQGEETFAAIITSVQTDSAHVRRCYREDRYGEMYMIKDVASAGLEYSMFVGTDTETMRMNELGRLLGRLSKKDMRNI